MLQPETNAAFAQNTQIKGTITGITTQLSETGAVQKAFNITKTVQGQHAIIDAIKDTLIIPGKGRTMSVIENQANNSTLVVDSYDALNREIFK